MSVNHLNQWPFTLDPGENIEEMLEPDFARTCATLRAFNAISRDCKCGKKCLQAAVGIFNHDIVIECVKYCQSEVFDKRHDDKFMIMRLKVEGMLRWLILIH